MFAEELSGNATRRRQDANRERRRKLKQEQQRKELEKKKKEGRIALGTNNTIAKNESSTTNPTLMHAGTSGTAGTTTSAKLTKRR